MRSNWSAIVLIGLSALSGSSCSVSRQATNSSSELRVQSLESVQRVLSRESERVRADSVVVEVRDTLREVTTITIDRNDKGDTLKVVQVTDLTRARSRDNVVAQRVKTEVRVDTVYVEKRDSVYVKDTNLSNDTNKGGGFRSTLKWIFAIIVGLIALMITAKVCLRRSLL